MTPPLGLATISSTLLGAGHQTKLFDFNVRFWRRFGADQPQDLWSGGRYLDWAVEERFHEIVLPQMTMALEEAMKEILHYRPDVIGFSVFDTSLPCTKVAARFLKEISPGIPIVFGGPGMSRSLLTSAQDFAKIGADFVIFGEGEQTILDLLEKMEAKSSLKDCPGLAYLEDGNLQIGGDRKNLSLKEVRIPDFSNLDFALYKFRMLPVMMSRGCVAKCTFCAETRFWKGFRIREAEITANEIIQLKKLHNISEFYLSDSLINGNHRILNDLAELLIEADQRIRWSGYARLDKNLTPELLEKLSRSGLYLMSFGLETGSQKIMDLMEKRTTVDVAEKVIRDSFEAGIAVNVNLVVGFPGEGEQEFQETLDFLKRNEKYIQSVSTGETLAVIAGTPLFEHPERFGIQTLNGGIQYDSQGNWVSKDGTNTYSIRRERLLRLREYLKTVPRIRWTPDGEVAQFVHGDYFRADPSKLSKYVPHFLSWKFGDQSMASPLEGNQFQIQLDFSNLKIVGTFRNEVFRTLKILREERTQNKIALCVSGGVGAEILGLVMDQLDIPYDCFFLDIYGVNEEAKKRVYGKDSYFRDKLIQEIRLERRTLFGDFGLEHFQKFGVLFPDQIVLSYLYKNIPKDYFILVGGGSMDRQGKFFESIPTNSVASNHDSLISGTSPTSQLNPQTQISPRRIAFPISSVGSYLWAAQERRQGEFQFYLSRAELILSQLADSRFQWGYPLTNWRPILKEEFPELVVGPKVSNWQGSKGVQENYLLRAWLRLQSRHLTEISKASLEDISVVSFEQELARLSSQSANVASTASSSDRTILIRPETSV